MKTTKKLLSSLLALAISVYAMPTVWAEDITQQIQDIPESSYSDTVITDNMQTYDEANIDKAETETPQGNELITGSENNNDGVMPLSLLPLETKYKSVTIDRSNGVPSELASAPKYSFFVREALSAVLAEDGIISEYEAYNGTIVYSFDNNDYKPVGWNDVISSAYSSDLVYFILGDDQLNISNLQYNVYVNLNYNSEIIKNSTVNLFNKNGESIIQYGSYVSNNMTGSTEDYFYSSCNIALEDLKGNNYIGFLITLPENYDAENVEIYDGFIQNPNEIGSAANITSLIINDGTGKTPYAMEESYSNYKKDVTFVITSADGITRCYPIEYCVYINSARISMELSPQFGKQYVTLNEYNYKTYVPIADASNFDVLNVNAVAKYEEYNNGSYNNGNLSNIDFACFGYYTSKDDAIRSGETNIKDTLFGSSGAKINFSKFSDISGFLSDNTEIKVKSIMITAFDKNGIAYHSGEYLGISDKINNYVQGLSDDTYFNIRGAKKANGDGSKGTLTSYRMKGSDDSYFQNGYQTLFILDNGQPITESTIYPVFDSTDAKIYIGNDVIHNSASTSLQVSGESPIAFKSGIAIQYSAASESGTHLKNYWVTFVTRQSGAKLFVNAVNNSDHYSSGKPQREIFLNNRYGYHHDIFFANIGDTELNGINVSLSDDTRGVKLDDYWTVINNSTGTLAPFTKTYEPDNIAKVRLVPADEDCFSEISGTLTIFSANGGSVDIELTGIAGVPKITTDKLYDGVKYVPYSNVIMTNSMYGSNSMSFSISEGSLPNGLELRPNGEIYGIPTTAGTFTFTVTAVYNGAKQEDGSPYSSTRQYTIVIVDNTDENVDATNDDDQGHELMEKVSKYITVYYNGTNNGYPVVDRIEIDSDLFWSEGPLGEFQDFYIDGIKLSTGSDYIAEDGSTKITVRAQTFGHTGVTGSDVPHTLAAEFRTSDNNELKRSAQNVYLDYVNTYNGNNPGGNDQDGSGSAGGNGGSNSTSENSTNILNFDKSNASVNAVMKIVGTNGDIIPGLSVELHSSPKYAKTDENGMVKFDSLEFGRHTLYINEASNNKKISKTFSISSGQNIGMTGNVITASAGDTVYMTIEYDGLKIKILSVAEDVSSSAGICDDSKMLLMDISKNIFSKRTLYITILLSTAVIAFVLRKKIKS